VFAVFVLGFMTKDEHGVSFVPTALLTLPWWYFLIFIAERVGLVSPLTGFYDLPLFAISAAEAIRRICATLKSLRRLRLRHDNPIAISR
jgi:hypothetical protein